MRNETVPDGKTRAHRGSIPGPSAYKRMLYPLSYAPVCRVSVFCNGKWTMDKSSAGLMADHSRFVESGPSCVYI